ncbi:hypothetical protein [Paracoccus sp. (in: a-proteobacteria)]|uniref:hypothetical protein n=1 Tax=Paracoccus sp. TaxID=267 RepID=UPI0028A6FBBE|nr:hypothetical protein [Paracoccus sp. (in: a-proteobacteria)]
MQDEVDPVTALVRKHCGQSRTAYSANKRCVLGAPLKFLPLVTLAMVSGCIDVDIAPQFVGDGNTTNLFLTASVSRPFVCVVAIYRASPSTEPPELASSFEPWSATPLTERVSDTAIELRVLRSAVECWGEEIRQASGSLDPWSYDKVGQVMTSFNYSGNIAFFDLRRGIFIAISG